jgi:DNA-binding NtrC family response regulator
MEGGVLHGSRTILIVDDEDDSREMLAGLLRNQGCRIVSCRSATEALTALESGKVDLIIADLVMAGMNGIELLRELRRRGVDTGFVMVTAYGEMESYIEVMNLGAVDYISKPISQVQLLQIIDRTFSTKAAARA